MTQKARRPAKASAAKAIDHTTSNSRMALDEAFIARVVDSHPLPIADAMSALAAAGSLHERRDRVVEAFRAVLRYAAALALAARIQRGPGPVAEKAQLVSLFRGLRSRGLTDGQWVALMRGLLSSWSSQPDAHPIARLAPLFCGKTKKKLAKAIDGLLEMRKSETVAHGATGSSDAIAELLARREPQLAQLLNLFEPVWQANRLVVPQAEPTETTTNDERGQSAYELHGPPPRQGRWRRISLNSKLALEPGQPILVDETGKPLLSLYPIVLFQAPSPEAVEELFLLDGAKKRAAVFVALPSMAGHRQSDLWAALGNQLFDEVAPDSAPPSTRGVAEPYRGLASFGPEHSALFFGREQQAQALANRIRRNAMLTLTGASGSGKSSLLYAGVFPLLDECLIVRIRPGADPPRALARQLARALHEEKNSGTAAIDVDALMAAAVDAPASIGAQLERFARECGRTIILFVDQGEELFTLCTDEFAREAFASALAACSSDPDAPLRVVLSLREDYFARIADLAPLRGHYARQVEVVATPDREELARIIIAPAQLFGVMFEDLALVDEMIDRVHGESAALAMLQFCAAQLWTRRDRGWKRLTWDAYRSIGGVEGALATHAEETYFAMTGSQQALARRMFLRLVTEENTRAVVAKSDLVELHADAASVLRRLLDARLLTSRESDGDDRVVVELVHEALLGHWARLRDWLQEDLVFVRARARLEKAATRWQKEQRPADLLLGDGKPLLEARELIQQRRDMLRDVEVAYIAASEQRSTRLTRLKRTAIAGLVVLALVAGAFGLFAWQARGRAEEAAVRATTSEKVAINRNVALLTEQGRREVLDKRPLRALVYLQDALEQGGDSVALRSLLAEAARPADALNITLRRSGPPVYWIGYDRRGEQLAAADSSGGLELFDSDSGESRIKFSVGKRRVDRLRFMPDDTLLVIKRGEIRFFDQRGNKQQTIAAHNSSILSHAVSADGQHLLSGCHDGSAKLWRRDGTLQATLSGHERAVMATALSPDGRFAATGSRDKTARIWDARSGELLHVLEGHNHTVDNVAFAPDNSKNLLTSANSELLLWSTASGELIKPLNSYKGSLRVAEYGPGGIIAAAGYDNRVQLFSAAGKPLVQFEAHDDFARGGSFTPASVSQLQFASNGKTVYTRGSDATVRAWDTSTGSRLATLMAHVDRLGSIAVRPIGGQLASAGLDGAIYLWNEPRGPLRRSAGQPQGGLPASDPVDQFAVDRNGEHLAALHRSGARSSWRQRDARQRYSTNRQLGQRVSMADNGDSAMILAKPKHVAIHDASGMLLYEWQAHTTALSAIAIAADGMTVATAAADEVKLWQKGKLIRSLHGQKTDVLYLAFSPNGQQLAGAERGPVRLWNVSDGKLIGHLPAGSSASTLYPRVRFSADGARLASMTSPLHVSVWQVTPLQRLNELDGALLDFSPDGKKLVVAATSPVVHVVDAVTSKTLASLDGHNKRITSVAFCADNERVVTTSMDGSVRVWDASSGKLLNLIEAHKAIDDAWLARESAQLITLGDGMVKQWDLSLEIRAVKALAQLVQRSSPWRLEHGGLVERSLTAPRPAATAQNTTAPIESAAP